MKTLTFAACCVVLGGCLVKSQNSNPPATHREMKTGLSADAPPIDSLQIDNETAKSMWRYYSNTKVKKSVPVAVKFSAADLQQILQSTGADSVQFFLAAYPESPARPRDRDKKNRATILMQTINSTSMSGSSSGQNAVHRYLFLSYKYFSGSTLCPPPDVPPCNLE